MSLNGSIVAIPRITDMPIRTVNGNTILIGDVAHVRDGSAPQTTIARQNDERGILNSIFKIGHVSSLDVVEHVKQIIPKMLEQMPEDINMRVAGGTCRYRLDPVFSPPGCRKSMQMILRLARMSLLSWSRRKAKQFRPRLITWPERWIRSAAHARSMYHYPTRTAWSRWDSLHYQRIAQHFYTRADLSEPDFHFFHYLSVLG